MTLQEKLDLLPSQPGVYLYKDAKGTVIYVGKAKRLKVRVRSYFQEGRPQDPKTQALVARIADLETLVTDSEAEALLLENTLIKQYKPKYNVMYRDDKSLPYLCITPGDRPRLYPTRHRVRDGSRYFGPYDQVWRLRDLLDAVRRVFGLCTCAVIPKTRNGDEPLPKWKSCFEEYVGQCSVHMPEEEYRTAMKRVARLLNGKTEGLAREIREEMEIAASALHFEQAARLRDGLLALRSFSEKAKTVMGDLIDRDIFTLETDAEEDVACGVLLRVREGKLVGRYHRLITGIEGVEPGVLLQGFVEEYYASDPDVFVPDEVHLSHELPEPDALEAWLWERHTTKVPLVVPKIGEKAHMVRMGGTNARLLMGQFAENRRQAETDRIPHSVRTLQAALNLPAPPRRIECFDNSNIQGSDPVASMVTFVDGKPRPGDYKKFHIKTVVGPDDFASMKEVLTRRYSRLLKEGKHIPDLIVVDGGKGQLSHAVEALREIGFYGQVPIIGLAKRLEEVFLPFSSEPVMLPKSSSALKLLQRLRDEAHRFAITFHRDVRSRRTFRSELTDIEGIGKATAEKLLVAFGSVRRIRETPYPELVDIVGTRAADRIQAYFSHHDVMDAQGAPEVSSGEEPPARSEPSGEHDP